MAADRLTSKAARGARHVVGRIRTATRDSDPVVKPDPPGGATDLVVIILDSLRHDSWMEVMPTVMGRLGAVERRFSYASWTAPSHYNLLTGLLPHASPTETMAADYYQREYLRYRDRLNVEIAFDDLLPRLWLPSFLRSIGYETRAMVSMPVLNPDTGMSRGFDDYRLMPNHHDMPAMVRELTFSRERPTFTLLNVGETHYPYATPGEDTSRFPRVSGVHGVLKRADQDHGGFFDPELLTELRTRQLAALESVDATFERLLACLPADTWVVVTSDHGELFGEGGYFGHGPINHEKVLEVPFVEGRVS